MTTASSRTPRSWLASSLTSRPKSTSPPASAATSSWGFTKCGYHQQQQHDVPAPHGDHNALIPGLFFLGGSNNDKGNEFRYGNTRVHLQTSNQGFVFGVGRGSVSILRITLRFTIDFLDEEVFGLGMKNEGTETERDGDDNAGAGKKGEGSRPAGVDGQHSLSLSLTMTITIMAVNSATLS
ncbi:hypothetical protein F4782DRAFT_172837 [Xylaria castorea]|nr:hypothetical protein F4782DRAFT_172837 [Xylaria castorea]